MAQDLDALREQFAALQAQLQLQEQNREQNGQQVCRVSVKLPQFWPAKPSVWFAQVEAQFELANIVRDETKFAHVVASLDSTAASEVDDIIEAPPAVDKYAHLKAELIRRLSSSSEERVRQILQKEELGDRRPSQFLRHLRSLAGRTPISDVLLRQLWLQRLPTQVQAILQTQAALTIDQIADIADRILEVSPVAQICAVQTAEDPLQQLIGAVSAIGKRLERLERGRPLERDSSGGPRPRSASRGKSRDRQSDPDLCFYHDRFGDRARKCRPPCKRAPQQQSGN